MNPEEEKKEKPRKQSSSEDSGGSGSGSGGGARRRASCGSKGSEDGAAGGGGSSSRRGSHSERIQNFISTMLHKVSFGSSKPKVLEEPTVEAVAEYMLNGGKSVIVMAGAGISTSAGIPDFRSPSCGLYSGIQRKYKLSDPQCMFEIGFFRSNPEPFFSLAKEIFPNEINPTITHHFIRLLHDKGFLLRHYTQNVDGLERIAGVPAGKIVEAHGSFYTSHCMKSSCRKEYDFDWMKAKILTGAVPKCSECDTTVKPDVVFFGEALPPRFFSCAMSDFPKCDMLLIMGTSLVVQPFAYLVNQVPSDTPRVLLNREIVGTTEQLQFLDLLQKCNTHSDFDAGVGNVFSKGLDFKSDRNRDVAILGDCDEGVLKLAEALGWKDDLLKLVEQSKPTKQTTTTEEKPTASSKEWL